jgi:brefeldin A-inhibited guanine nucleotide-exchange protein
MKKITLQEEIMKIPLNPIPYSKSDCPDVKIQNELGIEAGRYGWCMVCRNSANLYCKDTRHPVCSQDCKKKHLTDANALDGPSADNLPTFHKRDEASLAFTDAILVFRSIVRLSVGGDSNLQSNQQVNPIAMRTKIIGLELILTVLEKPKQSFLTKKAFIDEIKNKLCEGLLRYSVSSEKTVFSLVASIFFCLFFHFRKHLKNVILVFIETIFLKLLDSSNSSFHHKELILNVFDKIS